MEMRRIDVELIDDLRNEIELLKMLDHPNVIKLYEYYEDRDNIYLILEFCDGGELFDRLHQQKGNRYTEAEAARLMFRMCVVGGARALACVHALVRAPHPRRVGARLCAHVLWRSPHLNPRLRPCMRAGALPSATVTSWA